MKKLFGAIALWGFTLTATAQIDTSTTVSLEEAVIYSGKFKENRKNIAQPIEVITAKKIARFNSQNTGDLLISTGSLFVQKSQQGGSSPVIRGFEASRVLLVVDGIRLNNAIYRGGHLQNVITVDQNMLDRVEVLYGPTSTLYGSDALGGVIHLRTKQPSFSTINKTVFKNTTSSRISSVNQEKTIHTTQQIAGKKWAWLHAITYSDFGDMKMGTHYPKKYPDFGRRTQYIQTINGVDQLVTNENDRVQKFSGYKQWDLLGKLLYKSSAASQHQWMVQHSNSTNVPRYDRLQDKKVFPGIGNTLRWATWYYGPQTRWLTSYEWNNTKNKLADEIRLTLSYQDIKESRQQREYLTYSKFDSRREHVKVASFNLDAKEKWGKQELIIGVDGQLNFLRSVADRTNLLTGVVTPLDTRYPNGKNQLHYGGLYGQHLAKFNKGKLVLNDGLRLQFTSLHSTIADNSFFKLPYTTIEQRTTALTGNLGLVYMPDNAFRMSTNFSSGARTPNIDDLARIFESSSAIAKLVVPNPSIKPEYTYNGDVQMQYQIGALRLEITGFYTLFRNAITLAPFQLNGQDSMVYNGIKAQIIANQNARKAFLRGFQYKSVVALNSHLTWETSLSQTHGRFVSSTGVQKPLDHIPPLFGRSSILYQKEALDWEFFVQFNGWKRIKDYNMDGEDNAQYATPDGTPAWYTLNLRAGYQLDKSLQMQAGIENILDRNYRYFASGFSAPGRNVFLAIRVNF